MNDCVFCKIVKGELPNYTIYEDRDFLAFLDVFPRVKGHILVIPKKHYRWTYDVPNFGDYWEVVKKITLGIKKSMSPEFVTYVTHGLEVPHAHIHVMPRTKGETKFVPDTKKFSAEVMSKTSEKIRIAVKTG